MPDKYGRFTKEELDDFIKRRREQRTVTVTEQPYVKRVGYNSKFNPFDSTRWEETPITEEEYNTILKNKGQGTLGQTDRTEEPQLPAPGQIRTRNKTALNYREAFSTEPEWQRQELRDTITAELRKHYKVPSVEELAAMPEEEALKSEQARMKELVGLPETWQLDKAKQNIDLSNDPVAKQYFEQLKAGGLDDDTAYRTLAEAYNYAFPGRGFAANVASFISPTGGKEGVAIATGMFTWIASPEAKVAGLLKNAAGKALRVGTGKLGKFVKLGDVLEDTAKVKWKVIGTAGDDIQVENVESKLKLNRPVNAFKKVVSSVDDAPKKAAFKAGEGLERDIKSIQDATAAADEFDQAVKKGRTVRAALLDTLDDTVARKAAATKKAAEAAKAAGKTTQKVAGEVAQKAAEAAPPVAAAPPVVPPTPPEIPVAAATPAPRVPDANRGRDLLAGAMQEQTYTGRGYGVRQHKALVRGTRAKWNTTAQRAYDNAINEGLTPIDAQARARATFSGKRVVHPEDIGLQDFIDENDVWDVQAFIADKYAGSDVGLGMMDYFRRLYGIDPKDPGDWKTGTLNWMIDRETGLPKNPKPFKSWTPAEIRRMREVLGDDFMDEMARVSREAQEDLAPEVKQALSIPHADFTPDAVEDVAKMGDPNIAFVKSMKDKHNGDPEILEIAKRDKQGIGKVQPKQRVVKVGSTEAAPAEGKQLAFGGMVEETTPEVPGELEKAAWAGQGPVRPKDTWQSVSDEFNAYAKTINEDKTLSAKYKEDLIRMAATIRDERLSKVKIMALEGAEEYDTPGELFIKSYYTRQQIADMRTAARLAAYEAKLKEFGKNMSEYVKNPVTGNMEIVTRRVLKKPITELDEVVKAMDDASVYWDNALEALYPEDMKHVWDTLPTEAKVFREFAGWTPTQRVQMARWMKKAGINALDALGIAKTLKSSMDISMPFRQGFVLGLRHPVKWAKAWAPMFKAMQGQKVAEALEQEIRTDLVKKMIERGIAPEAMDALDLPSVKLGAKYMERMEQRASVLLDRLAPGFLDVSPIHASQRAATIFVQHLQASVWVDGLSAIKKAGGNINDYKSWAEYCNWAMGRGRIWKPLQSTAPTLNALLFSPRMLTSRLELPTKLLSKSAVVRKEAWTTLGEMMGLAATAGGLYYLATGETPEMDPRSADFGKLKFGNTRVDIWAGYAQLMRLSAQLITQQNKTGLGDVRPKSRGEIIAQFFRSKESPFLGLVTDLYNRQTREGDPITLSWNSIGNLVQNQLMPLALSDFMEALMYRDSLIPIPQAVGLGSLGFVGFGAQTYRGPEAGVALRMKASAYRDMVESVNQDIRLFKEADARKTVDDNPAGNWARESDGQLYSKTYRYLAGIERTLADADNYIEQLKAYPGYTPEQRNQLIKDFEAKVNAYAEDAWAQFQSIEAEAIFRFSK